MGTAGPGGTWLGSESHASAEAFASVAGPCGQEQAYPLTDKGFGNNLTPNWAGETFPDRNGSFTTEFHTSFVYEPGQFFNYIGDDDVWVFVDGKLAMDLGGLHSSIIGEIDLDNLGLVNGKSYSLDFFRAERCESSSNFRIDTSINCFSPQ